jgi:hypothetical protein
MEKTRAIHSYRDGDAPVRLTRLESGSADNDWYWKSRGYYGWRRALLRIRPLAPALLSSLAVPA